MAGSGFRWLLAVWCVLVAPAFAAPYAAIVMDARDGTVFHAENADDAVHPASLTKMMTLYIAFDAVKRSEIDLDALVRVSGNAASKAGSRLGLTEGQRVSVRDLLLATAIRSANDAATALAEAISGSEGAFVFRMNEMAAAMGLDGTAYRNPHGLSAAGHLTTARDMALLGRILLFDHPEFFDLFSKGSATIAGKTISHTNRRFLNGYRGADGIKTGYTAAAGFSLTASARRGDKQLIVTVMGAPSSAERMARVATLMDQGFDLAPDTVIAAPPRRSGQTAPTSMLLALNQLEASGAGSVLSQGGGAALPPTEPPLKTGGAGGVGLAAFGG